ncbi:MAG: DUF3108 domain-containing protein [bacterium]|jgi:hypothetical protein
MLRNFRLFLPLLGILLSQGINSQAQKSNDAFQTGEWLKYSVSYHSFLGDFDAGTAEVSVKEDKINGKPVFHVVGIGKTNSFFDMFYTVRDRFESRIDRNTLYPYWFFRRTRESDYSYDDEVFFYRKENIARSTRREQAVPDDIHDIISAVFYMRTLTVADFGEDSLIRLHFLLDDSVYSSVVHYQGRSAVETRWGWLPCVKVKPMMVSGEVFAEKYPMTVWVTDDLNHIPVMAESRIIVGSVRMELVDFDGLKNPFIESLSRKEVRERMRN